MKFRKFLSFEWDAVAGIVAAVVAIVLHLLHVVDEHVILPIVLALMALLFINFMRHTRSNELTAGQVDSTARAVSRIQSERAGRGGKPKGQSAICVIMYIPETR